MKMKKKDLDWIFIVVAAAILAWSLLYVGNEFVNSNKDNQQTSQWITNTLSVVWEWKAYVKPDTLKINLTISETWDDTKTAQEKANEKAKKIQDLLAKQWIEKKDIKTVNLNVYPDYSREENKQKLLWYRSQHTLSIQLEWEKYIDNGNTIIDQIAAIGNVNIDNTSFELKDQVKWLEEARKKAFEDAKAKAQQLADLWWVNLGKPIMITDSNIQYAPTPIYYARAEMAMDAWGIEKANPSISAWETEVTINLSVVYEIR